MENLDIVILTSIVSILFIVFIIATYREFSSMNKNEFKGGKESGPRANLMFFIGRLFTDERIDKKQRIQLLNIVKETIEVMESEANDSSEQKNENRI